MIGVFGSSLYNCMDGLDNNTKREFSCASVQIFQKIIAVFLINCMEGFAKARHTPSIF